MNGDGEMNKEMVGQLREVGEGTIYYTARKIKTDDLDLIAYRVLSDNLRKYASHDSEKGEKYYEWLRCWSYVLLRIKEEELDEPKGVGDYPQFLDFYKSFKRRTKGLTSTEALEVLYRLPWHMRTMLHASIGQHMITDFIHRVGEMRSITQLNFSDVSYFEVTEYDQWALQTLHKHAEQESKLDFQMQRNFNLLIYGLENYNQVYAELYQNMTVKDQYGMDLLTDLMVISDIQNAKENQFDLMIFALSSLSFWHFEINRVKSKWVIKKGKFKHLKRIARKMKIAL